MSCRKIHLRQDAVKELRAPDGTCLHMLAQSLRKLPDVERMLCSAYHRKVGISDSHSWKIVLTTLCLCFLPYTVLPRCYVPPFLRPTSKNKEGGGHNNEDLRFRLAVKAPPPDPTNCVLR